MGQWAVFLTRKGYSTIGVDFATAMIETLRERHPAMDWRVGQVQNLPVPTGSVDAVISWGVIEHDESGPGEALREFTRVLRPGGVAFITVPVDSAAQRRSSQAQFGGPESRMFFQYFLTADELVHELEGAGLAMLESVRPVSRHHALAYPAMYVRLSKLPPLLHRAAGWLLKPTLPLVPSSTNMLLAVARRA
jgi:ubiquinone/menaquinone biosynthesis C-methylase UbiE